MKQNPKGFNKHALCSVFRTYFDKSQSSTVCDILLILDCKCIKKELAYIDVFKSICAAVRS